MDHSSEDFDVLFLRILLQLKEKTGKEIIPLFKSPEVPSMKMEGYGLHLSLSRSFTLTFDQIDAFLAILRSKLDRQITSFLKNTSSESPFEIEFGETTCFVNDNNDRTFLSLKVTLGNEILETVLKPIDESLILHEIPPFYKV